MNKPKAQGAAIRAQLLLLAARAEGVSTDELTGFDRAIVSRVAWREASERGRVYRAGNGLMVRYFANPADAQRYEGEVETLRKTKREAWSKNYEEERRRKRRSKTKAPPPRPEVARKKADQAGVHIKHYGRGVHKDAPAVTPPGLKVKKCPSPPAFGPAARLLRVSQEQLENRLPALKVGKNR